MNTAADQEHVESLALALPNPLFGHTHNIACDRASNQDRYKPIWQYHNRESIKQPIVVDSNSNSVGAAR
jgi:hypothetical protein